MVAGQASPNAQKSFLREILSLSFVPDHAVGQMKHFFRITRDQPLESEAIVPGLQMLPKVGVSRLLELVGHRALAVNDEPSFQKPLHAGLQVYTARPGQRFQRFLKQTPGQPGHNPLNAREPGSNSHHMN